MLNIFHFLKRWYKNLFQKIFFPLFVFFILYFIVTVNNISNRFMNQKDFFNEKKSYFIYIIVFFFKYE